VDKGIGNGTRKKETPQKIYFHNNLAPRAEKGEREWTCIDVSPPFP
jgi:hypothetical protein